MDSNIENILKVELTKDNPLKFKTYTSNTIQHQKSKKTVLLDHRLGELFKDFYTQWNYDGHRLKTLCSLMYDVYIVENMFYTSANNLTNPEKCQEIIRFYRSLESLINQVNELKGEKII